MVAARESPGRVLAHGAQRVAGGARVAGAGRQRERGIHDAALAVGRGDAHVQRAAQMDGDVAGSRRQADARQVEIVAQAAQGDVGAM